MQKTTDGEITATKFTVIALSTRIMFVLQSCHAQTLDYDLAGVYLFLSLSLEREEEFENFQESATRTKINVWSKSRDK